MILEVAILDVIPGKTEAFEQNFESAQRILSRMEGYAGHQLRRCMEKPDRYVLLVNWETVEHHTVGFRQHPLYQEWKSLLHEFYDPFPTVEHYQPLFAFSGPAFQP